VPVTIAKTAPLVDLLAAQDFAGASVALAALVAPVGAGDDHAA